MSDNSIHEGHRLRLKQRFLDSPGSLSDRDKLELLLTYAIPRRDVRPLVDELLARFLSLDAVFSATPASLLSIPGMGEATMIFIKAVDAAFPKGSIEMTSQPQLFPVSPPKTAAKPREMRVFVNDEIATSLAHLPEAGKCDTFGEYKAYLGAYLPYNSFETRHRRANHILDRFYPEGDLDTPLTLFTQQCKSQEALKAVVFYHLALAEPLLAKAADEFFYPALPKGKIEREQLREFILGYLPEVGTSSQKNALRSIFYAYSLLGLGREDGEALRFQLRPGNLDAFMYVLAAEFPEPGIYHFDKLFDGPAHRRLLWDREWMRTQLYLLRDMKVISKVSEIDTIQQFSTEFEQRELLKQYFEKVASNLQKKQGDDL